MWPETYLLGRPIILDPAGALYSPIGVRNLRALTAAQEDGGMIGTSN